MRKSKEELYEVVKQVNIKGRSNMDKSELLEMQTGIAAIARRIARIQIFIHFYLLDVFRAKNALRKNLF